MSWSMGIGKIAGIPIHLHLTFLLLMGWLGLDGLWAGDTGRVFLALGLFACGLLHELGHCLAARAYGVRVVDITLLPIGGLARIDAPARRPNQELWIAAAGPAVNFVLAPLFHIAHLWLEPQVAGWQGLAAPTFIVEQLAALNLVLGMFNLLPAFPMDGGRILRALRAIRMPCDRATRSACSLGQALAVGLGFLVLLVNPWLILIALFVFIVATEGGTRGQTQALAEGVQVQDAAMTRFLTLGRADSVEPAARLLLAGTQQDFPVVEGAEVGVRTRWRLLKELAAGGGGCYVSEVMESAPVRVAPDLPLDHAKERLPREGASVLLVRSPAGPCGLLTAENLPECLVSRSARQQVNGHRKVADS